MGDLGVLLWVPSADRSLSWVQGSCGPKPAVKLSCSISPTGGDWGPFTLLGLCGGPGDPIVVRGCSGFGGQVTQSPPWCWCHDNSLGRAPPSGTPHAGPLTGCMVTLEHAALQTGWGPDGVLPVDPRGV